MTVHAERDHKSAQKISNFFCGFRTNRPFSTFVPNLLRIGRCVAEIRLLLYTGARKLTSPKRQFLCVQHALRNISVYVPVYVGINNLLLYITARMQTRAYFDSIGGYLLEACPLLKTEEE